MKKILYPVLFGAVIGLSACGSVPSDSPGKAPAQKPGLQESDEGRAEPEEMSGFLLDEKGVPRNFAGQPAPIGLCMTVAIKYQAAPEDIAKIKNGFNRFSELIWNNTWGNMYIKKVTLKNNGDKGYITLAKLKKEEGGHAYFGGLITVGVNLLDIGGEKNPDIGVRIFGAGILHEFNHSMFYLPDEYPYKGQPDKPVKQCVMDPRSRVTGICADCEQIILKRFNSFRFPAGVDAADWQKAHPAPAIYFTIK
jgi:hypothetical protein